MLVNRRLPLVPAPKTEKSVSGTSRTNVITKRIENASLAEDGYILRVQEYEIVAEATSDAGYFYAQKTLEQLRFLFPQGIPCVEIQDAPVFLYRSFHIDTARHFFPMEVLRRMVDAAAAFKLNRLHWHFSDDQGWRIESKAFPLLHEVGAKRKGDHFGKNKSDQTEHFYYTQAEVREFVGFCAERNVEIVPEVDVPGHVTALLAAYPNLSCEGKSLEVATGSGIFSDILCAGREETFQFLEKLLDELCTLFPGHYFHIGGDETPKTRWDSCPHCRERMQMKGLTDTRQLQGYMTNRIAAHLRSHGKRTIVWNEAALGGNLDRDIVIQLWNDDPNDPSMHRLSKQVDENGRPSSPNQGIGARMIREGHDVILSNMLSSYCDYPHAYVTLKNVYSGEVIPQKCENLQHQAKEHVIGGECLCWAEYIRSGERLEQLAWPRYAAKAEALWSSAEIKDYRSFLCRIKTLYPYLKSMLPGINPPRLWMPGPIRSIREMLLFAANFTKEIRSGYANAQEKM